MSVRQSVRQLCDAVVMHHLRVKAHVQQAERDLAIQKQEQFWSNPHAAMTLKIGAETVQRAAQAVAPGWLSAPWPDGDDLAQVGPVGVGFDGQQIPEVVPVCVGHGSGRFAGRFPVLVPLLGAGHVVINGEGPTADLQAGVLRAVLLRLAASLPSGSLRILPVDAASRGLVFAPFKALIDGGVMAVPAPDPQGFQRVLEQAEKQTDIGVRQGHADNLPFLIVAVASFPYLETRADLVRLAQLAKAGPKGRVHLVATGYPPQSVTPFEQAPQLDLTTFLTLKGNAMEVTYPDGEALFSDVTATFFHMTVDAAPPDDLIETISSLVGTQAHTASQTGLSTIVPASLWQETSAHGLATVMGLEGTQPAVLRFDDQTPHWLVGGPTGSGKTVFLIDLLYGLACRYSPNELNVYLLDFKEGVSFTEFTPRPHEPGCASSCALHDPTWIPHARVVGIESDRQYGVAVLRALLAEMSRRASDMKRVGVQNLAALRAQRPEQPYPRIVAVIDEFQHLFAGNDEVTNQAVALLEDLARKGRSYGIHLVLASQTAAGIRALYDKKEAVFGQFAMRIALRGSRTVLDPENTEDTNLPLGAMVVNTAAGHKDHNRIVRFPDATADPASLRDIRQQLWRQRTDNNPPTVFVGYARQHLDDDPTYRTLTPHTSRPVALVGRFVDVGLPTAGFPLDPTVGRHVAILGTKTDCAHVLTAAVTSLGKQHAPGTAQFILAPFITPEAANQAHQHLAAHGHHAQIVDLPAFRHIVHDLAGDTVAATGRTYLIGYGIDSVSAALQTPDPHGHKASDELQRLFRDGPGHGVHILGWWRGYTRFTHTVVGQYGTGAHHEVACLLALNIPASELAPYFGGMPPPDWTPTDNRAYLIDTGETHTGTIVPFTPADHTH